MIGADLPPNVTTLLTAIVVTGITVGVPLYYAARRNRRATEDVAEKVSLVHSAVEARASDIDEALAANNGGIGGQVRQMSDRVTTLLAKIADGQRTADETGLKINRLFSDLSEHRAMSERVHEEFRNELRTHFEAVGHPEMLEMLMRLVEQFQGPDGAAEARVIQSEVRDQFAMRKLARQEKEKTP